MHLSEPVVAALRAHRSRQAAERKTARVWKDTDGVVFTTPIGTPLDPEAFGKTVPRLCIAAGLGHWSIHELRHSCTSLLLAMGVPLEVVSGTLGHASIRVTMDVYGQLLAPARMKAAEAMQGDPDDTSDQKWVGRPGLDPGTLGLKVPCSSG